MMMFAQKRCLQQVFMLLLTFMFVPGFNGQLLAQDEEADEQRDLFEMSLEDLMNVEVTLASKKEERLFTTAAAVYVVTAEDIRRSGATSIPDALRMVPGVEVARINANKWAITARGFNDEFADKLLVMIDGRSIYTPLYGGVHWDTHDVMLEDVERIEVVRGPGGTLWGANAVNGVINIITKNAKDSQGVLLSGGGGSEEQGFGSVRYGGKIDDETYFRVYSKYFNRDDGSQLTGGNGKDGWDVYRGGFRIDSNPSAQDELTLLGDIYNGDVGHTGTSYSLTAPISQSYTQQNSLKGGNILGRWKRTYSDDSDMILQIYYDREKRHIQAFNQTLNTYDIDFQHRFASGDRHEVTWGLGYRLYRHTLDGTFNYSLSPRHRNLNIYSGFLQDRITLIEDKLKLTLGTKVEHNYFTGFEFQPSSRLAWTPDERNTVWAAVTRAIKTPAIHDSDATTSWGVFQAGPSIISQESYGNEGVESEEVMALELGYRTKATDTLLLDVAGFFNIYENLLATERTANISMPGYTIWPNLIGNNLDGETYGVEVSATYQAAENWKLNAGYTFLQMQLHLDDSSTTRGAHVEGDSPHNQFHLRSYLNLRDDLQLDFSLNYVDNVPTQDVHNYVRFDVRLGWQITKDMELSIVGQNLFDGRHPEFGGEAGQVPTEAERGIFARLRWEF